MGSVKHPHLEKNAEKLEKTHKSSVHILRLEQKPWTGFKGGEKLTTCCFQPQGKSSVREGSGELLLHKSREQCPQLLSAVLQEAASLERSCSHSHGSVGWLRQAGKCSGLAGVRGCPLAQSSVSGLLCKELLPTARQGAGEMGDVGCWGSTEAGGVFGKTSLLILWSGARRVPGCVHELEALGRARHNLG